MKIRRDIASIPKRSAADTWRIIRELITAKDSVDSGMLSAASSVMESIITDEFPATVPIVVKGAGDRLIIYLLYNEDALEADLDVDKLNWNPTAGDWEMTVPVDAAEVAWINKALAERAPRIKAHDMSSPPDGEDDTASKAQVLAIDWSAVGSK